MHNLHTFCMDCVSDINIIGYNDSDNSIDFWTKFNN